MDHAYLFEVEKSAINPSKVNEAKASLTRSLVHYRQQLVHIVRVLLRYVGESPPPLFPSPPAKGKTNGPWPNPSLWPGISGTTWHESVYWIILFLRAT
jgi:hypothetical protein